MDSQISDDQDIPQGQPIFPLGPEGYSHIQHQMQPSGQEYYQQAGYAPYNFPQYPQAGGQHGSGSRPGSLEIQGNFGPEAQFAPQDVSTERLKKDLDLASSAYTPLNITGIVLAVLSIIALGVFAVFTTRGLWIASESCNEAAEASFSDDSDYNYRQKDDAEEMCNSIFGSMGIVVLVTSFVSCLMEVFALVVHYLAITAYKAYDYGKFCCVRNCCILMLILGVVTCNIVWCVIYGMLMFTMDKMKEPLRQIDYRRRTTFSS